MHSNSDRTERIFHAALALPESERKAFVANECADDPNCVSEVNSLLEAGARSGFLDVPVVPLGATDSFVGTTIDGRYKVESELPHGAMGKVYLAHHLELPGKFVVIKVLPQTSTNDPDAVRRFKQEVQALALIDHPGVVTVFGAGEREGKPYIVMEYIDGPTLRSEIPSLGIELRRAAVLIKQIGAAVGHVHDRGILHRDLKPENIMLQLMSDGTDVVRIVDFGIAKIKDSVSATSTVNTVPIGTLAYMSPEQLRDGERIAAASDVYSMAVVACEIITGQRPGQPKRGRWHPKRVELPKSLSPRVHQVISKALSFDPNKRYQSARQFGDELAEALVKDGVNDTNGARQQPLKKWLAIVSGVLIFALLSYGIYKYFVQPPPLPPSHSTGFNYWVIVQRTRDGKEYQVPIKSNGGDDIFDNGDKFQLSVLTLQPGYLYIFNEGPLENATSFRMIYPKRLINDGSASVGPNDTVTSDWSTFRGPAGTEDFWIVWSVSPVSELESARKEALNHPQAGLTDQTLMTVKQYLKTMNAEVNARTAKYKDSQEVKVRKSNDLVLTLAQFKHR
jgi:serine/threonine protein kinase